MPIAEETTSYPVIAHEDEPLAGASMTTRDGAPHSGAHAHASSSSASRGGGLGSSSGSGSGRGSHQPEKRMSEDEENTPLQRVARPPSTSARRPPASSGGRGLGDRGAADSRVSLVGGGSGGVSGTDSREGGATIPPPAKRLKVAPPPPQSRTASNGQHKLSGFAPTVSSAPRTYSAAFNTIVEERFDVWSTSMYASNSFLYEIGATARLALRDRIREALEAEWRADRRTPFTAAIDQAIESKAAPSRRADCGSSDDRVSCGGMSSYGGERPRQEPVGLINQGATCYLNALVQALYADPSFRAGVEKIGVAAARAAVSATEPLPAVTKALVELFHQLRHSQYAVSTEGLTSALKWGPVSRQQDVHEFWTMLCERIEADLKGTAHGALVEDLFQGEQRDYVRCHTCGTVSHRTDRFQDLKLAVPHDEPGAASTGTGGPDGAVAADGGGGGAVPPGGTSCTANVREALRQLLTPEQLRGSDMYQCDCCGCKTDAERGVQLTRLPPILTLQLKRFRYDFRSNTRAKISSAFDFPLYLDMTPFVGLAGPVPALAEEGPTPMDTGDALPSAHESAGARLLATLDAHDDAHDDTSAAPSNASSWATSNAPSALSGGSPTMTPFGGSPTMTPFGRSPLSAASTEVAGDALTMDADTPTVAAGAATGGTPSAAVYELYAVLVHKGSASFGHYYALLQDVERGEWYEFNDATVKPIKPSELRRAVGGAESAASGGYSWSGSTCAYMLLYRQVTDPKRIPLALAAAAAAPGVMATPQDRFPSTGGHTLGGAPGGARVGSGGTASGGTPVGGSGVRMSRLLGTTTSSTTSAGETRSPLAPPPENAKRLRETSEQTDEPASTTHAAPICFTHETVEEDNPYARMGF